jgi:hypothetical protein
MFHQRADSVAGLLKWVSTMRRQITGTEATPLVQAIQNRIASRLRTLYASVPKEPLPGDHVDLLLALRHKERERRRS